MTLTLLFGRSGLEKSRQNLTSITIEKLNPNDVDHNREKKGKRHIEIRPSTPSMTLTSMTLICDEAESHNVVMRFRSGPLLDAIRTHDCLQPATFIIAAITECPCTSGQHGTYRINRWTTVDLFVSCSSSSVSVVSVRHGHLTDLDHNDRPID